MKRKLLAAILAGMMMLGLLPTSLSSIAMAAETSIPISDRTGLENIKIDLNGNYRLTADIDLAGGAWTPLQAFSGTLDGGDHIIKNLSITDTTDTGNDKGLFASIAGGGQVKNLGMEGVSITAGNNVGAIAGSNAGTISRCYTTGAVSGNNYVGGISGANTGTIENCYSRVSVSGKSNLGGLAGRNTGSISTSYAASTVTDSVMSNYLEFNATNKKETAYASGGYVSIPNNDEYKTDAFTLEAWFQRDSESTAFIISKSAADNTEWFEIHTNGNGLRFIPIPNGNIYTDTNNYDYGGDSWIDVKDVLQNGWFHVAAVYWYDSAAQEAHAQVYVNGEAQDLWRMPSVGAAAVNVGKTATIKRSSNPLADDKNKESINIGRRGDGSYYFDGKIADVRFWNTARTAEQIKANKDKMLNGDEQGLVGYWKLNDSLNAPLEGKTVADSTENNNSGTITGAVTQTTSASITSNKGALTGDNAGSGSVADCFYDSTVSKFDSETGGAGTPKTTEEMKAQSTYTNWDFSSTWKMGADGYPNLDFKAVTSVTVTPATAHVLKGKTQSFSANVEGVNGFAPTVNWTVEGKTSASTTITPGGVLTVGSDETAGTLTVRATSADDTAKSGTAVVAVAPVIQAQGSDKLVFANGFALVIEGVEYEYSETTSTIYIDENRNGVVDAGEKSLKEAGVADAPEDKAVLANNYYVYGGSAGDGAFDTQIVMQSGEVAEIYGGSSAGVITGDASITVTGGAVSNIYGGSRNTGFIGNTNITISGGTINNIGSGGSSGPVSGNTTLRISGGTITGDTGVSGGNANGTKKVYLSGAPSISSIDISSFTGGVFNIDGELTGADGDIKLNLMSMSEFLSNNLVLGRATTPTHANAAKFAISGYNSEEYTLAGNTQEGTIYLVANTSTLTVDPNGGTWNGSADSQSFTEGFGSTKGIPVPTRTGYAFTGWTCPNAYGDLFPSTGAVQVTYGFGSTAGVTDTLTAQWKANSYTVSYNGNEPTGAGSVDVPADASCTYDLDFILGTTSTLTYYTFGGWYKDVACTEDNRVGDAGASVRNLTAENNATVTLYAKWTAKPYTVTYNTDGGSAITAGSYNIEDTSFALPAAPTKTGYTFTGWKVTSAATGGTGFALNDAFSGETRPLSRSYGNVTLTAQWKANGYSVTLDGQGATVAGSTSVTATYDADMPGISKPQRNYTVTFNHNGATGGDRPASSSISYNFGGYFSQTEGGTMYYNADGQSAQTWNIANDATLYAHWTAVNNLLPVPTKTDYDLAGWYTDAALTTLAGAGGAAYTPTANVTLYAKWTATPYTVTYNTDGGSAITSGSYNIENTSFTLPAAPTKTGYRFTGWKVTTGATGGTGFVLDTTFDADATSATLLRSCGNVTLTAQWVTYHTGGGDHTPSPATVYNELVLPKATIWLTGIGLNSGDLLITERSPQGSAYKALMKLADRDDVFATYNIYLRSGKKSTGNPMTLNFDLNTKYAGDTFTLVHQKADSTYEYFYDTADANGNLAFGPLYELSPFMLVKGTLTPASIANVVDIPKTGDNAQPVLWAGIMLIGLFGLGAVAYIIKRKRA